MRRGMKQNLEDFAADKRARASMLETIQSFRVGMKGTGMMELVHDLLAQYEDMCIREGITPSPDIVRSLMRQEIQTFI